MSNGHEMIFKASKDEIEVLIGVIENRLERFFEEGDEFEIPLANTLYGIKEELFRSLNELRGQDG